MATKKKGAAKKTLTKKAPAKKAPVKKAPVKKAPAKAPADTSTEVSAKGLYGAISTTTGVAAVAGEAQQDYAVRVCQTISEMTDDDFSKLNKQAQDWFDKAVEAINAEKPTDIPSLSGFPDSSARRAASAKTPAAKNNKKKSGGEAQATLPGVAKGGKARVDSVAFRMRLQVVRDLDISFDDACKGAKLKAERGSNAWNAYFNAVQTMRIARAEGIAK